MFPASTSSALLLEVEAGKNRCRFKASWGFILISQQVSEQDKSVSLWAWLRWKSPWKAVGGLGAGRGASRCTHQISHTLNDCTAVDAAGNLREELRFYLQFLLVFEMGFFCTKLSAVAPKAEGLQGWPAVTLSLERFLQRFPNARRLWWSL